MWYAIFSRQNRVSVVELSIKIALIIFKSIDNLEHVVQILQKAEAEVTTQKEQK